MLRNKLFITSILLILASAAGGIFYWRPKLQEFLNSKKELERIEMELSRKEQYFSELNIVSKELEKYSQELAKIDSALAIDPSIPALFHFIKKSVSENGLAVESLIFGGIAPSLEKQNVKEISFSLSVSGTYPAFKNFLSTIYKNSRIIEINTIGFSSPLENELFNFSMRLTTYSYLLKGGEMKIR